MSKRKRIGLVGAVDSQPSSPSPAIDLYRSADFLAARRHVESSCDRWFILSPRYSLTEPGDWLEPYRETMAELGGDEREAWSGKVLGQLEKKLGSLKDIAFEIHAGPEFYEHGLAEGLRAAKARVVIGADDAPEPAVLPAPASRPAGPATSERTTPAKPKREKKAVTPDPAPPPVEVPAAERRPMLDEFYGLLEEQAELIGGYWSLPDCSGDDHWPQYGAIFFFEPGELREDGKTPRVVRVGTHALTPGSKIRLWDRLRADRGTIGGANPGSGNHRASALRRHIGRALIARDGYPEAAATWGSTGRLTPETKQLELALEVEISRHIADMDFIWMAVPDLEDRLAIESGAVSLLSNLAREAADPASPGWLGHRAGETVSGAGLWNIEYTERAPEPGFLSLLRRHLDA